MEVEDGCQSGGDPYPASAAATLLSCLASAAPPFAIPVLYALDACVKRRGAAPFRAALAPALAPALGALYRRLTVRDRARAQKALQTWADAGLFPEELPAVHAALAALVAEEAAAEAAAALPPAKRPRGEADGGGAGGGGWPPDAASYGSGSGYGGVFGAARLRRLQARLRCGP
jgi:hypothetical protein